MNITSTSLQTQCVHKGLKHGPRLLRGAQGVQALPQLPLSEQGCWGEALPGRLAAPRALLLPPVFRNLQQGLAPGHDGITDAIVASLVLSATSWKGQRPSALT